MIEVLRHIIVTLCAAASIMAASLRAEAQPLPILDALGGAKYCRAVVETLPRGWGARFFLVEFGPAMPCLQQLARTGKPALLGVQALWRSSHKYGPREEAEALRYAPAFFDLARQFPAIEWQFSPFCEHQRTSAEMAQTFAKLRRLNPPANVRLINSPMTDDRGRISGGLLRGERNEWHGIAFDPPAGFEWQNSLDGIRASDIDVRDWQKKTANHKALAVWDLRNNCNQQKQPKIAPKDRKPEACADANYLRALISMMESAPPAPAFPFKLTPVARPILFKVFAEDEYGKKDVRANRPVFLSTHKAQLISVKASNGKEVARFLRQQGDFAPGIARHYSGTASKLYGFEIANRARRETGNPYVSICDGSRCFGPIDPRIRQGYFR